MNIARMCMVVGVAGLLVAQANAHDNAERKDSKKVKKSTGAMVMEYLPYAGYTCAVLGFISTFYYKGQAKAQFQAGGKATLDKVMKHVKSVQTPKGDGSIKDVAGTLVTLMAAVGEDQKSDLSSSSPLSASTPAPKTFKEDAENGIVWMFAKSVIDGIAQAAQK